MLPPQNDSKSSKTYLICKLPRYPWFSDSPALNLFLSRCCHLYHLIAHLPIVLHEKFGTLWTSLAKVMPISLQRFQVKLSMICPWLEKLPCLFACGLFFLFFPCTCFLLDYSSLHFVLYHGPHLNIFNKALTIFYIGPAN